MKVGFSNHTLNDGLVSVLPCPTNGAWERNVEIGIVELWVSEASEGSVASVYFVTFFIKNGIS